MKTDSGALRTEGKHTTGLKRVSAADLTGTYDLSNGGKLSISSQISFFHFAQNSPPENFHNNLIRHLILPAPANSDLFSATANGLFVSTSINLANIAQTAPGRQIATTGLGSTMSLDSNLGNFGATDIGELNWYEPVPGVSARPVSGFEVEYLPGTDQLVLTSFLDSFTFVDMEPGSGVDNGRDSFQTRFSSQTVTVANPFTVAELQSLTPGFTSEINEVWDSRRFGTTASILDTHVVFTPVPEVSSATLSFLALLYLSVRRCK